MTRVTFGLLLAISGSNIERVLLSLTWISNPNILERRRPNLAKEDASDVQWPEEIRYV